MKRFFASLWLVFVVVFAQAQNTPYNVVFDMTSKDSNDHKAVIRWVSEIAKANPEAKLEVVFYGQSLDMVQKDKSVVAPAIIELAQNKNITFKVCAAAMKRHNIDASQLLPGVGTVPDGIYEIVLKEKQGWGYIKAKN